jgi:hypothetical protein
MASFAYGTPQPQINAGLDAWQKTNIAAMQPKPLPNSQAPPAAEYKPAQAAAGQQRAAFSAYSPGAAQPKTAQSFGTPYGGFASSAPYGVPQPSWGNGSANPVYTPPPPALAHSGVNEQMERIKKDAEAYNTRLRQKAEEDARRQQEYTQQQQDNRLARADWLTGREREANNRASQSAQEYFVQQAERQRQLLDVQRNRPPKLQPQQPPPPPPPAAFDPNAATNQPGDPPWMVALKRREAEERARNPPRKIDEGRLREQEKIWTPEAIERNARDIEEFRRRNNAGPTEPRTGGLVDPFREFFTRAAVADETGYNYPPPQTSGPMYPQPQYGGGYVGGFGFPGGGFGGGNPYGPQTSFYRDPVQSFGGSQFPPAGFYPSYGSPFGGQFGQPQTGQIDAFIQRLNDTMTPYHTGVLTGQPQFNMNQLWGQAGNMVQGGWQNPFAF